MLPGATFTPYLSIAGDSDAFALMSASKGWNLAGLKSALLSAGTAAAGDLAALPEIVSHGPSHLGVIAHTAALNGGEAWLDALLVGLAENRALLTGLIARHLPSVKWTPPEATYLAWLDCTHTGLCDTGVGADSRTAAPVQESSSRGNVLFTGGPTRRFLDDARVARSAGAAYGPGAENHVRLNFATSSSILSEAIRKMGQVVSR